MREPNQIGGDIIDSRDVIARLDWVRDEVETQKEDTDAYPDGPDEDLTDELSKLEAFVEDIRNNSGDSPEDGATLIADHYFERYAEELADDIGAIDRNASWPVNCIDWTKAASELQMDYSTVEYDGVTFWVRS